MKKPIALLLFPFYFLLNDPLVIMATGASLISTSCAAQDLKVISGTVQKCSGSLSSHHGSKPAGHHVVSYHFYLSPVDKDVVFDSLYMPGIAIKLVPTFSSLDTNGCLNLRIGTAGDTYDIFVSNPPLKATPKGQGTGQGRQFTGPGIILYTYKGRTYVIPIVNMKQLQPIIIK